MYTHRNLYYFHIICNQTKPVYKYFLGIAKISGGKDTKRKLIFWRYWGYIHSLMHARQALP
jgi:hypothetical protein